MENTFKILYIIGYETLWKPETTGEATPARHRVDEKDEKSAGSIPEDRLFSKFCFSLVGRLSEEGIKSPETETGAWEAAEIEPATKADIDRDSSGWSDELRIFNGSLDTTQSDRCNRRPLWDCISSESSVEIPAGIGVELSETGEKGSGTGREGDCTLEKDHVAVYKKKPSGLKPTWCSLTKAVFSWFPVLQEHGHLREKHQSCDVLATGRKYRPFRLSVFPLNENISLSMPDFILIKTSECRKLSSSFVICSSIFADMWYCSGTEAVHTKEPWLKNLSTSTPDCIVISFPDMLQNSILTNSSGICLNVNCLTVFQKICDTLNNFCMLHSKGCVNLRSYYGPVFIHQIYHGVNIVSITYA